MTTDGASETGRGAIDGERGMTRREFTRYAAVAAGAAPFASGLAWAARSAHVAGFGGLRVGLIGCGGRGTGAAANMIEASPAVTITALADVFEDRLNGCRDWLSQHSDRAVVEPEKCYVGWDAYQRLIAEGEVDVVILATPPHFRPMHFEETIRAGKHVFMEKPVAVDPVGIRRVWAAGEEAERKGLCVVAGTQRRHETSYLEAMKRLRDGIIGDVVSARCYWNMGELWSHDRKPEWTDMEWQLRNWLYFTWLSGDHIVEQHVHNLDVVNWAVGASPVKCLGMGGRQARTEPRFGHIFDHFAVEFEYPNGVWAMSMCRQSDGTAGRVEEVIHGTKGWMRLWPGYAVVHGENSWEFEGRETNPYVQEHVDLIDAIINGSRINEARQVADSTLTAVMGRMSAYTGQEVSWEFAARESKLDLSPAKYEFGEIAVPPVAVPGETPLV